METLPEQTIFNTIFLPIIIFVNLWMQALQIQDLITWITGGRGGKGRRECNFWFFDFSLAVNQNEGKTLYFLPQVAVVLQSHFCLFLNNLLLSIIDIIAP